jgi:hypothetical protein
MRRHLHPRRSGAALCKPNDSREAFYIVLRLQATSVQRYSLSNAGLEDACLGGEE